MSTEIYRPLDKIRLGKYFPVSLMPTEEERREVNRYFKTYLFYKDTPEGREIWTSCCRRAGRITWGMVNSWEAFTSQHNHYAPCPFCRRMAQLKATRHLGKKKSLEQYEAVVFLREWEGELLALAAWVKKDYQADLLEEPQYHITSTYRFRPGHAIQYLGFWGKNKPGETAEESGDIQPKNWRLTEPFTSGYGCMYSYDPYYVIGIDAIERSAFRYCQYETFAKPRGDMHTDLMRYLAASCVYPRDMEMLVKSGMQELVRDLLYRRRKNARAYRWGAGNVREAFGLDGQELRTFMHTERNLETLELYKELRKRGGRASFELAEEIRGTFGRYANWKGVREFMRLTKTYPMNAARALRYTKKQITPCAARHGASYKDVLIAWADYLNAASALGYDVADEAVLMPKDLTRKHDEATEELTRRTSLAMAENNMDELEKLHHHLARRMKKYDFAYGGYIIRLARNAEEITAEGQALKHCVGGYASRHMEGKTTILFLRKAADPNTPLATIEMDGNKLRQIRGYRNDANQAPASRTYKRILDEWLDWLKRGSPRNKDGTPKLRKKKGEKAA